MRASAVLLLMLGVVFADDAPKVRTFKDGKLVDPYFGLTYEAPGLTEGMFGPTGATIFDGSCPGNVEVEILVQEAQRDLTAAEWLAAAKEEWAKTRKMADVAEGTEPVPWILFVEETPAGFRRHHGYAFYARGPQAFIVHATVQEKSDTSADAIRATFKGLTLDPQVKPALLVYVMAKLQAQSVDDPRVMLAAGQIYLAGSERMHQPRNIAMAEQVLERAVREAAPDTFNPDELWGIHEFLGLATLEERKLDAAIGWFTKSEQLAAKASGQAPGAQTGQSSYNLACAYALSEKLDEAFAALDRCVAKGFLKAPENLAHMKEDTDLANCHKDPRWEAYFKPAEAK